MSETEIPDTGTPMHPLRAWRERHGITPSRLAQLTGLSKPTLWRAERGQITPEVFWQIVDATKAQPHEILHECPFCRREMRSEDERRAAA